MNRLKKLAAVLVMCILLTSCASEVSAGTVRIGLCDGPYKEFLQHTIEPYFNNYGYEVSYVFYDSYSKPNYALMRNEIDINLFQNVAFLETFIEENGDELYPLATVPTLGMVLYSQKFSEQSQIPKGAKIAIPDDVTNKARAVVFLESCGLIKISPRTDRLYATQYTIESNPLGLEFVEMPADQVVDRIGEVDVAVVNGNYAYTYGIGHDIALSVETVSDDYLNVLVINTADKKDNWAILLNNYLSSIEYTSHVADYILQH